MSIERFTITLGRVFRRMGLPMWTFLGIGVCTVWFNTIGSLIEKFWRDLLLDQDSPVLLTYVPLLIVFIVPFGVVLLSLRWLPRKTGSFLTVLTPAPPKKGLIILVSKAESALFAIRHHLLHAQHQLAHVWLLPSNECEAAYFGKNSRDVALVIKAECEELARQHNRALTVDIHPTGVSPADAQDTYDYVNRLFRQGRFDPREIIADFTGGTKPMSVGMIMACLPTERELEYVSYNPDSRQSHGPFLINYQHSAFNLVG